MPSNTADIIEKVILQTRDTYVDILQSDYVSKRLKIDGVETRGQVMDSERTTSIKEENTKTMTCMLDVKIKRGSFIEIMSDSDIGEYNLNGIVISIPNKTAMDFYFTALLFNTTVTRKRSQKLYDDGGNYLGERDIEIQEIPCFVQRVGLRERQVDVGIDNNSVNELITTKTYDIEINDILSIGNDNYIVNDIKELDKDIFHCYMTYYRG